MPKKTYALCYDWQTNTKVMYTLTHLKFYLVWRQREAEGSQMLQESAPHFPIILPLKREYVFKKKITWLLEKYGNAKLL